MDNTITIAELEAAILRGLAAGMFNVNVRNPATLAAYSDFTREKQNQLEIISTMLAHPTPAVEAVYGRGEDALLRNEAKLGLAILAALDAVEDPSARIALDAVLRAQMAGLAALGSL